MNSRPRNLYEESALQSISDFHNDQRGSLSMVNIVGVLFGLLLFAFLANVGHVVNGKIKAQNSADAVAYSGAIWQARGMNAITAANHIIGELAAIIIIQESVGGELLDDGGIAENEQHLVTNEHQGVNTGSKLKLSLIHI